jgi:hypothetical protein
MLGRPPRHIRTVTGLVGLLLLPTTLACAPVFTDARLVGKGRTEITPHLSGAGFADLGEAEHLVNNFGAQVLVGVHDRLDLGIGYVRAQAAGRDGGGNIVEFGPKLALVPDRVAFAVPVGFAFGDDGDVADSWHLIPTVLFTIPVDRRVDINPAFRVLIPTCDSCDVLLGVNVGAGIRFADDRAVLRPEFGILVNPGETGIIWQVGFGVSVRLPGR